MDQCRRVHHEPRLTCQPRFSSDDAMLTSCRRKDHASVGDFGDHLRDLADHFGDLTDHVGELSDHFGELSDHFGDHSDHLRGLSDHRGDLFDHFTSWYTTPSPFMPREPITV